MYTFLQFGKLHLCVLLLESSSGERSKTRPPPPEGRTQPEFGVGIVVVVVLLAVVDFSTGVALIVAVVGAVGVKDTNLVIRLAGPLVFRTA